MTLELAVISAMGHQKQSTKAKINIKLEWLSYSKRNQ
jgi:hypothetical protein